MNTTSADSEYPLSLSSNPTRKHYRVVATYKVPHHSSFSGYELLINYVHADKKIVSRRGAPKGLVEKWLGRLLRRFSLSRWYQMDGVQAEWAAIRARLKTRKPIVLHYLYGDAAFGLLPYVCKFLGIRLIATIHSCPKDIPAILRQRSALDAIYKYIVLGRNQISVLEELGISADRIKFIPHGVDASAFSQQRSARATQPWSVLIVGNWKRRHQLYTEVSEIYSKTPGVLFHCVTRHAVPSHLANRPNVKIWRNVADSELKKMYLSSNCMLLALEEAVANNVILEAMASGLPVICEKVGAVCDYLGEEYPLLFEAQDPRSAVERIEMLRSDPKFAASLSDQLRSRASAFDWAIISNLVEELYDDDISADRSPQFLGHV